MSMEPSLHLFIIPNWFSHLFLSSVTLLAFWKGGWRERVIASLQPVYVVVHSLWPEASYWASDSLAGGFERGYDAVMLAVCLICARRADRYWVIWASAFALLSVVTDVAGQTVPHVTMWAYSSANVIWTYLLDAAILWGVWGSARDRPA
ncbi:MAG: hypothetical protein ABI655_01100 [Phenylobacterium sp.]